MSPPKHDTVSDTSHPDPRQLAALPAAALVLVAGVAVTALWWDHDRTTRDEAQARQFVLMADVVARRTEARIEEHRRRLLVIGGESAPMTGVAKAAAEPKPGTLESEADFVRHLPTVSESLARKGVGVGSLEGVDGGLEPSFLLFTPSATGDGALAIRLKASPLLRTVLDGWEDRITASFVPRTGDAAPSAPSSARDDASSPRFRRDLPLNVGGDWLLAVRSTPGYDAAAAAAQGRVWAWGVPLSVLLAGVAYGLGLRRPRVPVVQVRPSPRALADALPASLAMFDREFVVTYVNARARQVLGISEDGDPDLQWRARIHPQDRTLLAAKPWQVRSGAGPFEVEVRIRDARDEWRRIAIEMTPRRAESGTFEGFSGVFVDVTDRVAAEEAGARSARFLAATIDAIPTPVFVKDSHHRFVMLNRAAIDWTGWNVAEVIGKTDVDMFPPDVAEAFMAFDREALAAGAPVRFERDFPRAADRTSRAVIHEATLTLPDGSPGVVLSVADLSDERRLEARLAENLSFQRAIHESASCAIVSTDGSGFIRSINAGAEQLLADGTRGPARRERHRSRGRRCARRARRRDRAAMPSRCSRSSHAASRPDSSRSANWRSSGATAASCT
jgi:PAS domain S-box-containing protein